MGVHLTHRGKQNLKDKLRASESCKKPSSDVLDINSKSRVRESSTMFGEVRLAIFLSYASIYKLKNI
jgi:hypothetical protein